MCCRSFRSGFGVEGLELGQKKKYAVARTDLDNAV